MEIFKIISIGLIGVITCIILKNSNSSIAPFVVIATGIIILLILLSQLQSVLIDFSAIVDKTNIPESMYKILLKIVGIGYLTEYSVSICDDFDCKSIGQKIAFGGKISIFLLAIPIFKSLLDLIIGII